MLLCRRVGLGPITPHPRSVWFSHDDNTVYIEYNRQVSFPLHVNAIRMHVNAIRMHECFRFRLWSQITHNTNLYNHTRTFDLSVR